MNKTKHTAGPWRATVEAAEDACYIKYPDNDIIIAEVWGLEESFPAADDEAKANAALITVAPDLLEALKGWVAEQDCVCESAELEPGTCLYCQSQSAITKATTFNK